MRARRVVIALALTMLAPACAGTRPTLTDAGPSDASASTTTRSPKVVSTSPPTTVDRARDARVVVTSEGVVLPVRSYSDDGWQVTTPCGKEAVVHNATPIIAADVVIDPGHGGSEVGAVADNGLRESDLNLQVARDLQRALEADHLTVQLTREGDYRLPIVTRADVVNALHPKVFLSIHHNGGNAAIRKTPGTEVYYQQQSPDSKRLAGLVWEETTSTLSQFDLEWYGAADAGAIYRPDRDGSDFYGVLRRTEGTPAVLVEAAYLSNLVEADQLAQEPFREAIAGAIARGVTRYLTSPDPGSGFKTPAFRGYASSGGGGTGNCKDPALP
jgi:N-acetylmuramoyl-L-alanine amidase